MSITATHPLHRLDPDLPAAQAAELVSLLKDLIQHPRAADEVIALGPCRPGWHTAALRLSPLAPGTYGLFPLTLTSAAHPWEGYAMAGSWISQQLLNGPDADAHVLAPLRAAIALAHQRNQGEPDGSLQRTQGER